MQISKVLFDRAQKIIPGGVNSPVRAFKSVGGEPLFIDHAAGPYIYDVDGCEYIDYVGTWGPAVLGHASEIVTQAIIKSAVKGTSFGAPSEAELELAELIISAYPSVEMIRMVSSGTEATMSALRLARGYTKRELIIKFNGCYHGHADSLLVAAGSGVATCGIAGSAGVPETVAALTISIEYNDLDLVDQTIKQLGGDKIAAIIVEPVAGNMGLVLPKEGYLQGLREICDQHGIVLIFDEVMTGFRIAFGGAQERFKVQADLTTFGKIIGGGLPVGAFGGKSEIMKQLAPLGPVYQAGTLSGNPLAMAAGIAVLNVLKEQSLEIYPRLERLAERWVQGMRQVSKKTKTELVATNCGSMLGMFFTDQPVANYNDTQGCNVSLFKKYFHSMLSEGIYLAPSAFEAGFLSTAHTEELIDKTLQSATRVLDHLRNTFDN